MRGTSRLWIAVVAAIVALPIDSARAKGDKPLTDLQIRNILIEESIAAYPGNCPCPYSVARNGSRCGGRSAWSRPGGASPYCYPKDVSNEEVRAYREEHMTD
jgi:hypothetical protein